MASRPARRLVLLRHAKSAWPDLPDHDRPLAGRGRGDAPAIGRWLRETGCVPDLVWCSTASRAAQTWQLAAAELGADPPVSYQPRLYGATGGELAELIREAPATTATLLLVGHNPGIQELALMMAGTGGDPAGALDRAAAKFPTAAVAVLEFDGGWPELSAGGARLVGFVVPRELRR
ncbi:MAG: histidine phosphatase family protein [Streptosporangiaceae bacterium]|jgi:phosphohistidine phosphatase